MPEFGNPSVSAVDTEVPLYYPGQGQNWEGKPPEDVGIDPLLLQEAIAFANDPAHAGMPADIDAHLVTIYLKLAQRDPGRDDEIVISGQDAVRLSETSPHWTRPTAPYGQH